MRRSYETARSISLNRKITGQYINRVIEPYEEWKLKQLQWMKDTSKRHIELDESLNSHFQYKFEIFPKKHREMDFTVPKDFKLSGIAEYRIVAAYPLKCFPGYGLINSF